MRDESRTSRLVGKVLSGAWRSTPFPPLEISEPDLDEVTPLLYGSGGAALGWRRISKTHLKNTASGEVLHQAYRLQSLQSAIQEQRIEKVFRLLRHAQVDAILVKGWAASKLYSETVLRPYGDIDICVRAEQFKLAKEVLSVPEANDCWVDLHKRFSEVADRTTDELFERSTVVKLGEEQIRILGAEDHLALLAIHLLKHGAWRPLWLCDIGAGVESAPATFDWNLCLGSNKTRARWIVCAIGLARQLLGANTENVPVPAEAAEPPAWLVENILKQWANPFAVEQPPMSHPIPMADLLRHPTGLPAGLRQRWPNPIIATVSVNGEFNNLPRLPYQMANCISRVARLIIRWPGELQEH